MVVETLRQLKGIVKEHKLKGYFPMRKDQLGELIRVQDKPDIYLGGEDANDQAATQYGARDGPQRKSGGRKEHILKWRSPAEPGRR